MARSRLRLKQTADEYPEGTPLFGKCKKCGAVLPYPPIQVPREVIPAEDVLRYSIVWDRYCLPCGVKAVKKTNYKEIIPKQVWDPKTHEVVKNPIGD